MAIATFDLPDGSREVVHVPGWRYNELLNAGYTPISGPVTPPPDPYPQYLTEGETDTYMAGKASLTGPGGVLVDDELPPGLRVGGGPLVADLNAGAALDNAATWHTNDQTLNLAPGTAYCSGYTIRYGGSSDDLRYQFLVDINSGETFERIQKYGTWEAWTPAGRVIAVSAVDIYLSPDGDDVNGDGTRERPKKDLVAAVADRVGQPTRFMLMPGVGDHVITSTLELDASYHELYAEHRVVLDASGVADPGPAIYLTASKTPPYHQTMPAITNVELVGAGKAVSGAVGIQLDRGAAGSAGPSHLAPVNLNVHGFETGLQFGNRCYILDFWHLDVWDCGTGLRFPNGVFEAGERMTFHGGAIYNNADTALIAENWNGSVNLIGVSLDYNGGGLHIIATDSTVNLYGCHMEAHTDDTSHMIYMGGRAIVNMYGGVIVSNGTVNGNSANFLVQNFTNSMGQLNMDGVTFLNTRTATGELVEGSGSTRITNAAGDSNVMTVVGRANNLAVDGDMELASIVDDWRITADTAAITDPHDGANVDVTKSTLEADEGVQSMRLQKHGGTGTAAEVTALFPLTGDGRRVFAKGKLSKPDATTGSVDVSVKFARVTPELYVEGSDTHTHTFTAAASGWIELLGTLAPVKVPKWATHVAVVIDMASWDANGSSIYVDDLVVTTA